MTDQQTDILCTPEVRELIEQNIDRDPTEIALTMRSEHHALVASQVKYLQRCRTKLPSYYAARCIIPDLSFEQSSSERCAAAKRHSGQHAIDLTCGLGVDSLYLSKHFAHVTTIERNDTLARIARINFERLGVDNIEVISGSAEEYLQNSHLSADLIYADPDRRGAHGEKLVLIGECSPDVLSLKDTLVRIAPVISVKLSPMLDTTEAVRQLGVCTVEALSEGGECKELIAEFGSAITTQRYIATIAGVSSVEFDECNRRPRAQHFEPERYRYLLLSDVALRKIGCAQQYLEPLAEYVASPNGYAFGVGPVDTPMCRSVEIESISEFDPKSLKRELKAKGIRRINILKRDFPLDSDTLARQIGVTQGGSHSIAFTRTGGTLLQIVLKG